MEKFDVFLCHNSNDKPAVIEIAKQLQQQRIVPWLDIWHLRPGFSWQRALEQQIDQIGAAAVFVGGSGFGPWQSQEIDGFLREFVNRQCPVIPVLLPDAPQEPKLPIFLQGLMWVDFRLQSPEPMGQLIWGITGEKPRRTPIIQAQSPTIPPKQELVFLGDISLPKQELVFLGDISPPERDLDDLFSEKGIDYTRLRDLLAAKNWKEADQETYRLMIKAVGKEEGDYFTSNELLNFPCTDLRTIDRLWVKYSNGHFGFSVQKEIYLSVGGKADGKYNEKAWEKFGDRVGWRVGIIGFKRYVSYSEVTFNTSLRRVHLPEGYLPSLRMASSLLSLLSHQDL
ncbi:GUN4 domain-containing protein [Nostoc sp. FACHB-888]|uniref:GUN4 domain-containing protein n=1 Tax=Nostoc sp. FACHB-888 TaxID=2692842 RepID=UPI0016886FFC|nr:GUN4 domain-containing protein [Nostoc sp. FACHB-888]MBD2243308.1 GUN4 domain-containing protein [Nostoc sp. FACHB-888]